MLRRWKFLFYPLVVLALFVFFLPTFLGQPWVTSFVISHLEDKYDVHIEIGNVHLSWGPRQKIYPLRISKGPYTLKFDKFYIRTPLIRLFLEKLDPLTLLTEHCLDVREGSLSYEETKIVEKIYSVPSFDSKINHFVAISFLGNQTGRLSYKSTLEKNHTWSLECLTFPVDLLSKTPIGEWIAPVIGSSADIKITYMERDKRPYITAKISSPCLITSIEGFIQDKAFCPTLPIEGSFSLGSRFIQKLCPTSQGCMTSLTPIPFSIAQENCLIPLDQNKLSSLNIDRIEIGAHKTALHNVLFLNDLLTLIELSFRFNEPLETSWEALTLRIHEGKIYLEKPAFILLENLYPIKLSGNIDFEHDDLHLELFLTKETLEKALLLQNIPSDTLIPLKITGHLKEPHLHKSKALRATLKLLLKDHLSRIFKEEMVLGRSS